MDQIVGAGQGRKPDQLQPAGGSASTYAYDGDGLRSKKTAAGGSAQFMAWDYATGDVPLLLSDTSSTFYIYGPGDTPIEQIKTAGNTYLMGDQLGSTVLLTNNAGLVKGAWTYDAYGKTTSYTGTLDTTLLYNGQYQDAESGLYYLRARFYDTMNGQFAISDPLEVNTRHPYAYAAGNPLMFVDPTGLGACGVYSGLCRLTSTISNGIEHAVHARETAATYAYIHTNINGASAPGFA